MPITVSPTQEQVQGALRAFLLAVLPAGTEVVRGQDNKVPEPQGVDFVVMIDGAKRRLATNQDGPNDCRLLGGISGLEMTATEVDFGTITVGAPVFGAGVADGTYVSALGTGTGGVGTYQVSQACAVAPGSLLACGTWLLEQDTELTVALHVHGPSSADNAQIITTAFRDDYATTFIAAQNANVAPLYADDPLQVPFVNGEDQWEDRWIVQAKLQVSQTLGIPQQYADSARVGLIDVDSEYPAN